VKLGSVISLMGRDLAYLEVAEKYPIKRSETLSS
jgi:hypothetical protein